MFGELVVFLQLQIMRTLKNYEENVYIEEIESVEKTDELVFQ